MRPLAVKFFLLATALCVLSSCETQPRTVVYEGNPLPEPEPEVEEVAPVEESTGPSPEVVRAMILADMLYEARQALEDNRLMPPTPGNAYDRYFNVLAFDPQNEIALQGLEAIVQRYVLLANSATGIGQYDEAAAYLNRAERINNDSPEVKQARQALREAMATKTENYLLDPAELSRKSPAVMSQLSEIGQSIYDRDARFLITARNDAEGRWIYTTMREAVGGERLRGNIAVGSVPGIQVSLPTE